MAARSNAWVCGPLACWDCGFESLLGHDRLSLVSVVCCQVEVSATGLSLVQRSPNECGVSVCDQGTSHRRPRPTRDCRPMGKKNTHNHPASHRLLRNRSNTLTQHVNIIIIQDVSFSVSLRRYVSQGVRVKLRKTTHTCIILLPRSIGKYRFCYKESSAFRGVLCIYTPCNKRQAPETS